MLNIVDLEKRWMRYKIKSYIPHMSIFISLIVIASIFLSFSSNKQAINKKNISIPIAIEKNVPEVKESAPVVVQKAIKKVVPTEIIKQEPQVVHSATKVKLSPSLDFMRKMQNSVQPYYKNETRDNQQTPYQVRAQKVEVVEKKQVIVPEYVKQVPLAEPEVELVTVKKIRIKRQNTQNDIFEIITRFKKNNNPALSLFVAKKYYELGDYQQAYNYALITNKINKEIESSWIVFSKSLVKLGKRDQAIKTLKKYIKQSHSSSARILLDEIYAGKFK